MRVGRLCFVFILLSLLSISLKAQLTYKELRVLYDSAWTFKNLQLIPVRFKPLGGAPANEQQYTATNPISLSEAMQKYKHKVKLQEMQYKNGADVNWLQVTNKSKADVMVQSGEIVQGGKQDRMVGETKVIPAGTTDYLHVYCVEKRRWEDKPKKFKTKGVANSDVRKSMDVNGRQSEVWREIDRQFITQKKESNTAAYLELYGNSVIADTSYINYFTRRYNEGGRNYAGFIFISGNRILSTELFGSPALLDLSFTNMLNSYIQTAIIAGAPPTVRTAEMKTFMDKVILNEVEQKIYVTAHGKIHKKGNKVIHLIAYTD
jgi:hypothetical protein